MSIGTVEHVQVLMQQELDADERALAELLLERAELMIKRRAGDSFEDLDPEVIGMVAEDAVCRVLRNPDGWTTQAADGFSASRNSLVASGFLTILPSEWDQLGLNRGAFVIVPEYDWPTPRPLMWQWGGTL